MAILLLSLILSLLSAARMLEECGTEMPLPIPDLNGISCEFIYISIWNEMVHRYIYPGPISAIDINDYVNEYSCQSETLTKNEYKMNYKLT